MLLAQQRVAELEARLAQIEALPDSDLREVAVESIQGLMNLYGSALARILELAPEVASRLGEDELSHTCCCSTACTPSTCRRG